jgi:hypothetical protein
MEQFRTSRWIGQLAKSFKSQRDERADRKRCHPPIEKGATHRLKKVPPTDWCGALDQIEKGATHRLVRRLAKKVPPTDWCGALVVWVAWGL